MVERRDVQLAVEAGDHLRGWLFWPEAGKAQHPAVSMAHGYAGVKECGLERFAQSFAEAGFVVLVHDHRNFGASDGAIRHDIDPWRQIADWRGADALLVDTFLSAAQTAELADWIAGSGKRLATIYITHAYPDHFFGVKPLRDRFPEAQAIAPPQVVDAMQAALAPEAVENWRRRFPGLIPSELATAERLDGGTFDLEGREIVPIDIGHTDTDHTTCLHLPSIGLVIAGGAIYNSTHPYLVESNRQGLGDWLAAIDKIQALNPCAVVVGHGPMEPDNAPRHIQETRHYIKDFIRLDDETRTAQELYDRMLALYPDRINPGSLWGSANAAKASRRAVPWRDDAVVTPQTPPRIHSDEGGAPQYACWYGRSSHVPQISPT